MFRVLLILLPILFLTACKTPHKTMFQASPGMVVAVVAHQFRTPCYTTSHGILVSQFATECPAQELIESITEGALSRIGVKDKNLLAGLDLVFVPQVIICGPPQNDLITLGCTLSDGSQAFVFLAGSITSWSIVVAHELGHATKVLSGVDGDGDHLDEDFWDAIQDVDVEEFE